MARKKKLNPIATALTIAAVGLTGFVIWKLLIEFKRKKLKAASMQEIFDSEPEPNDILDSQFEVVNTDQYA